MNHNPRILILLATYNGLHYLPALIESITNQKNVQIQVNISDDNSNDGTYQYIENLSTQDVRFKLLPTIGLFGSAGRNFYRLITDSDFSNFDYVAFADQDDIWFPDKLSNHVELIKQHKVDAVSSNVIAFWSDGKEKLIKKSQPQREHDYIFESAGPGCTFLMTPWLVNQVKQVLSSSNFSTIANSVALHDWLTYAVCRSLGHTWLIDSYPSVQYRQHAHNVIGANNGCKAKFARFRRISDGWYRNEVLKVLQVSIGLSDNSDLKKLNKYLISNRLIDKLRLLSFACKVRRRFSDRMFLAFSILFHIF